MPTPPGLSSQGELHVVSGAGGGGCSNRPIPPAGGPHGLKEGGQVSPKGLELSLKAACPLLFPLGDARRPQHEQVLVVGLLWVGAGPPKVPPVEETPLRALGEPFEPSGASHPPVS